MKRKSTTRTSPASSSFSISSAMRPSNRASSPKLTASSSTGPLVSLICSSDARIGPVHGRAAGRGPQGCAPVSVGVRTRAGRRARHIEVRSPVSDDRPSRPTARGAGMATAGARAGSGTVRSGSTYPVKGSGWVLFAGIMIAMVGVLNAIYGIAAISNSKFFVADTKYILSNLNTWGWVMLVLGGLQLGAAFSVWSGGAFGRWFGIAVASLNAIAALLAIPAYPLWSLCVFAIDVLVIYALAAYGGDPRIANS